MTGDMWAVSGLALWHLAMVNSLSMYSGEFIRTAWIAPKSIIFSFPHKIGVMALVLAAVVFVVSAHGGWLDFGIWLAGALVIGDAYLTYRAFYQRRGSR